MDSILNTVKETIGPSSDYSIFDDELIMHINSVFFTLNQLGVGPKEPFTISDSSSTWDEFVDEGQLEAVKTYVCQKVRLIFDPPTNSALLSAIKEMISEYEWRLNVEADEKTG